MKFANGRCPECGHKFFNYNGLEWHYGSPIRTCKKCGEQYADTRYHEIEIDGIARGSMSAAIGLIPVAVGAFCIYRGICLSKGRMLGTPEEAQWFMPAVILLLGCAAVIYGIVDIIRLLTGSKAKNFEKLRMESDQRLQDYNYAHTLKDLGYPVPEKYL